VGIVIENRLLFFLFLLFSVQAPETMEKNMALKAKSKGANGAENENLSITDLKGLAVICGVSAPTMQLALKEAPTGAKWLIERGGRGRGYKILARDGAAWFKRHKQQRAAAAAAPSAEEHDLARLRKHMLGDGASLEDLLLPGKRRYEEYKAAEAELAYRKALGELCPVAEMHDALTDLVIRYRSALTHIPAAMRRRYSLEREAEDWLYQTIADGLKEMVRGLDAAFHADYQLSPLLPDEVRPPPVEELS
jgi:phage terminase Nu1 subunit (DNA packaging protein)